MSSMEIASSAVAKAKAASVKMLSRVTSWPRSGKSRESSGADMTGPCDDGAYGEDSSLRLPTRRSPVSVQRALEIGREQERDVALQARLAQGRQARRQRWRHRRQKDEPRSDQG